MTVFYKNLKLVNILYQDKGSANCLYIIPQRFLEDQTAKLRYKILHTYRPKNEKICNYNVFRPILDCIITS